MIGLFNKSKLIKSSDSIIIQLDSTGYNFKLSFHRHHLILLISSFHHQFIFDSFKASWPFLLINIRIHSSFRLDLTSNFWKVLSFFYYFIKVESKLTIKLKTSKHQGQGLCLSFVHFNKLGSDWTLYFLNQIIKPLLKSFN